MSALHGFCVETVHHPERPRDDSYDQTGRWSWVLYRDGQQVRRGDRRYFRWSARSAAKNVARDILHAEELAAKADERRRATERKCW